MENGWPWWPLIVALIFMSGFVSLAWYTKKKRRDALAQMASRLGLSPWPNDSLPRDLSLRWTPFDDWEGTRNVYSGLIHGQEVAVLDVSKGWGRGKWSRTIFALRTSEAVLKDWYGLDAQRADAWVLFYRPVGLFFRYTQLMSADQIERRLLALASRLEVRA
jgi:hypothetical protein